MKEADLDWLVYHLILREPGISADTLAQSAGCETDEVCNSLERLRQYLLIEPHTPGYRVLSTQEMLIRCQCTYDLALPYIVENGVVRIKRKEV